MELEEKEKLSSKKWRQLLIQNHRELRGIFNFSLAYLGRISDETTEKLRPAKKIVAEEPTFNLWMRENVDFNKAKPQNKLKTGKMSQMFFRCETDDFGKQFGALKKT